jgi:hypothetical protein
MASDYVLSARCALLRRLWGSFLLSLSLDALKSMRDTKNTYCHDLTITHAITEEKNMANNFLSDFPIRKTFLPGIRLESHGLTARPGLLESSSQA